MDKTIQKESHIWRICVRSFFIGLSVVSLVGDTAVNVKVECSVPNVKAIVGEPSAVENTSEDHCK